jgi:hypothetical protein
MAKMRGLSPVTQLIASLTYERILKKLSPHLSDLSLGLLMRSTSVHAQMLQDSIFAIYYLPR